MNIKYIYFYPDKTVNKTSEFPSNYIKDLEKMENNSFIIIRCQESTMQVFYENIIEKTKDFIKTFYFFYNEVDIDQIVSARIQSINHKGKIVLLLKDRVNTTILKKDNEIKLTLDKYGSLEEFQ